MPKRTTMLAILAGFIAAVVIFYLVSRSRVPAGTTAPTASAGGGDGGQRSDESRITEAVGAGISGVGDVVGSFA